MTKRLFSSIFTLFIVAVLTVGSGAICDGHMLSGDVMRLRVIANSDSDEDQELKLRVRDAVLEAAAPALAGAEDLGQAEEAVRRELDSIRSAAYDTIRDSGSDYDVTVTLSDRQCPRREYGSFALPAGEYCTLQVEIGRAEGRNWWCVVYPDVCSAAARGSIADSGLSDQESGLLARDGGAYEIRFWLLDTVSGVKAGLFG